MHLARIFMELRLVEAARHCCPGARQWRHFRTAFHLVAIPLMYSQITCLQAKETNAGVALTARRLILNIYMKQIKFICIVDSISRRDMVPTLSVKFMTVNIVKLFTRTLACTYSIIHSIRQTILSPVYDF